MSNFFKGFRSAEPETKVLPIGSHEVKVLDIRNLDSFTNWDGSAKSNLPQFSDPTEQLGVLFGSVDGRGTMIHRFNGGGYRKYANLTPKELASGKFHDIDGYACTQGKNGEYVRIPDEQATKSCVNIMNGFFHALGLAEGSTMDDVLQFKEDGEVLSIDVSSEMYNGKEQRFVTRFKRVYKQDTSAGDDLPF